VSPEGKNGCLGLCLVWGNQLAFPAPPLTPQTQTDPQSGNLRALRTLRRLRLREGMGALRVPTPHTLW
jgi:hypothetical protein